MIKKKRVIILFLVLAVIIAAAIYFFFRSNNSNAFSVSEKKWIETNKNQVIDIAVLNNLPFFGVDGEGIFFDFVKSLEEQTGLKFNMISYNIGEKPLSSDYSFEIKAKDSNVESSFYTDYYVVIGNETIFNSASLMGKTVGILKNDINLGTYYLENVALTSYDDTTAIFQAYKDGLVEYIVVPYLPNVKTILANDYNIAYRLTDMANKYVLTSNSKEVKLNSIMTKYFNTWMETFFESEYKDEFVNFYFNDKKLDDQTKSTLLSKKYIYGYVSNLPYEKMVSGELVGINSQYLSNFSVLTGVEFVYKKYATISELKIALNKGDVDLSFGYFDSSNMKVNTTAPVYGSDYVVLTHITNDTTIDSLRSLDDSEVMIIKDSLLYSNIKAESKAKIVSYKTIDNLLRASNKNSIIVINKQSYDYFKNSKFQKYTVIYESKLDINYSFLVSTKTSDKVFSDIFNYYVDTINKNGYLNMGYNDLVKANIDNSILNLIIKYIVYVSVGTLVIFYLLYKFMSKKKIKKQIKKEDKLKFVDMLTSLKNRNYLNYNMAKWDNNSTYPQAIVIIDLNNVQYINDNFGHEEGDNVIVSAANILINNQLENSDIIRTDGNEFLVYLVGYKEDEIITYIRKLNKDFKGLTHGFGAALGYSIIKDEITTIDDAINEATLDMRTNKESLQD